MNEYRTDYCNKITEDYLDQEVTLSGWIENIRDHGGVLFLDLRDETGVVQLVSNDESLIKDLTKESTVTVNK